MRRQKLAEFEFQIAKTSVESRPLRRGAHNSRVHLRRWLEVTLPHGGEILAVNGTRHLKRIFLRIAATVHNIPAPLGDTRSGTLRAQLSDAYLWLVGNGKVHGIRDETFGVRCRVQFTSLRKVGAGRDCDIGPQDYALEAA